MKDLDVIVQQRKLINDYRKLLSLYVDDNENLIRVLKFMYDFIEKHCPYHFENHLKANDHLNFSDFMNFYLNDIEKEIYKYYDEDSLGVNYE